MSSAPVLTLTNIVKDYRGLRPLRIQELVVFAGDRVALAGFDQITAEVFVNLVTGATLPDQGRIVVFDRPTGEIVDSADWLSTVDRFGIISHRAVLLEQLTALQNLAMPFTLNIDPLQNEARERAADLAREVRVHESRWNAAVADLDEAGKNRIRAGRALALDPGVLLVEHASAGLPQADADALARDLAAIAERRGTALVALTADEAFGRAIASRVLRWEPATGRLRERRGWFGGRLG